MVWGARHMVQRNALVYRRVWRGSVFSSFLQPTLFLLALGAGLGALVDAGGTALPGGVRYIDFIAPGLLAAAAMQSATFESTYPVLGRVVWHRNYDAIGATPMSVADMVRGELAWIAVRLTTIAGAFLLVMALFGIPRWPLALLAVPLAVLTGLAFAAPIMAYAVTLSNSATFNVLYRFGITPLFLFSGVFFPITRLPGSLELVAWLTPLFHGVELIRGVVAGPLPASWAIHLAYLVLLLIAGEAMARRNFRRRLHA